MMSDRVAGLMGQLIAVAIALAIGAVIILAVNESPLRVLVTLIDGAFGNPERIAGTLLQMTPILICGIAACISLRGGLFNIGIEGQLFIGGFAATWVGFSFALPPLVHVLFGLAFAALAGMLWIAVPAFFRARFNTNEVVSTILANYVAILLTSYLTINVFKRPGGQPDTPAILESAYLPQIFSFSRLNWGLFIGVALAIGAYLFFTRTARGYAVTEMGANPKFAEYGGIDIKRQTFVLLLVSGAVGGLAGGIESLGVHHRFMEGFAPGFGFDGVIAALLANGSPIGTIVTALFFGALRNGSLLLEVDTTASREIITVIQALIILAVSAQILVRRRASDSTAGERRWKF
ncbi:simple sugar transport system permease protein [Kaistia hirudinis]|uniref:Simple sugar transport system permease protein n=2 Tax=Kaistia hirudinis TaxID=1293440 RepID=A0A840AU10_9HYPH|nr:ABC transporter permease [Kaistia hirudinis]MBB3932301.1 simple sugar transport system permease protein [Kaistia hirudinis]